MTDKNTFTFSGRIRSITFALRGIRIMVASQQNAWIHAAATVAVVAAGLFVRLSWPEWCWIVLAIVSVWTAEALNTAFEFLTDVASPGFHPIAGQAKDVAGRGRAPRRHGGRHHRGVGVRAESGRSASMMG